MTGLAGALLIIFGIVLLLLAFGTEGGIVIILLLASFVSCSAGRGLIEKADSDTHDTTTVSAPPLDLPNRVSHVGDIDSASTPIGC